MSSKVLVVGPSWVGDMVMADSLFQHLQATGACVDVLAPGWSLPVLERMPSRYAHPFWAVGILTATGSSPEGPRGCPCAAWQDRSQLPFGNGVCSVQNILSARATAPFPVGRSPPTVVATRVPPRA